VVKFARAVTNGDGNICKIKHVSVSVDDSEEKMIFLVKMQLNERDTKPKLITYLTSIQKTLAKVFSNGGPKFTDEVIYVSNVAIQEMNTNFQVRQAFFHKEHGLFMKVQPKKSIVSNRNAWLFFLPRTSLFTGKDTNQFYMKLSELHLMQNPSHHKDVSFISLNESTHYIYLFKDLLKASQQTDAEVYTHKNTYPIREKFVVKLSNQLDFKLNLA
jgi:hypothetical protein